MEGGVEGGDKMKWKQLGVRQGEERASKTSGFKVALLSRAAPHCPRSTAAVGARREPRLIGSAHEGRNQSATEVK